MLRWYLALSVAAAASSFDIVEVCPSPSLELHHCEVQETQFTL